MINKRLLVTLLYCILIMSCNKQDKSYYPEGEIHFVNKYNADGTLSNTIEYYQEGKIKSEIIYGPNNKDKKYFYDHKGRIKASQIWSDSLNSIQTEYYENKKVKSKGSLYNGRKNGWWYFYATNGSLKRKSEILTIDDEETLNQETIYNSSNEIDFEKSKTFTLDLKDTLKIGRSIGRIIYEPELSQTSQFCIYIGENILPDYSNLKTVKLDTFYSKNKKNIWFGLEFREKGNKEIRGVLEEFTYESNTSFTELVIKKRYTYFHKHIYVID